MPGLEGQALKARYRIEALIGRGGMADVYKALDTRRQHAVAIKVMRQDLAGAPEFAERFRAEAETLAALSHGNIIRFYSFERDGPLAFIVMDYVAGSTLRHRLRGAAGMPLPVGEVASVIQQVCSALHYAHAEGVLHLDVKPGNVILRPDGHAFVADFGIAQVAGAAGMIRRGAGTAAYMSPEQCHADAVDARSDIYSLAVVAYEMLAGRRPFSGETAPPTLVGKTERICWEQEHTAPLPLAAFNPAVPHTVESAIMHALSKVPAQRFASAMELAQAFGLGPDAGTRRDALNSAARQVEMPATRLQSPRMRPVPVAPAPAVAPAPKATLARPVVGGLRPSVWVVGAVVLAVLVVMALALSSGGPGGRLPLATAIASPVPQAAFDLCVEPTSGDLRTTFYITVAGWDASKNPRYRFSLTRPDGKQTWEQELPDQLAAWSCGGAPEPGFRFGITPETNESPGTWEVTVEALPTGSQATVTFRVTP